jgi:uncharacterized protein YxjI
MNPKLIIEQKITAFVNKYVVYAAQPDGQKGQLVAFAQQKRMAFKEKVTFYADTAKTQPLCTMRAEKVLDVHGRYLVEDMQGQLIGSFRKQFKKSLINSTWSIMRDDQPVVTVRESNQILALLRRFAGLIPYIGELIDLITVFFRYHFVFTEDASGQEVGGYRKITLIRDHYELSMTDQAYSQQDWRLWAAFAVALDALQSR